MNKISRRSLLKIASGLTALGVVGWKIEDDPEISEENDAILAPEKADDEFYPGYFIDPEWLVSALLAERRTQ